MIITHLIYDKRSLCACSLTCYSWYTAAVPHLHHTLIIKIEEAGNRYKKRRWPILLWYKDMLGLLPLVRKFHIRADDFRDPCEVSSRTFHPCILWKFSALTNIQELGIDFLDIPKFIPWPRWYFGQFLPRVRSLALRNPRGSHRQIIYFVGLFRHLEDLKLLFTPLRRNNQMEPVDDLALVPRFSPPLRGRLTMTSPRSVELVKDMIGLFRSEEHTSELQSRP